MTETTRSDSLSRGMRPDTAKRLIASFTKRFKQPHLYFAQHAAFPMALTTDLLYRLWINFRRNTKGEMLNIPWIAVADLLLSPLCNEVGHELYEMDVTVRTELLKALKDTSDFGQQRMTELSNFLLDYIQQHLKSNEPDIRDFAQTQQWTALAFAQPNKAARELATALIKAVEENDKVEQVRIVSLMETLGGLSEPLAALEGFVPLLTYARGVAQLARGEMKSANVQFSAVQTSEKLEQTLGVRLPIIGQIQKEQGNIVQQAQDARKDFLISYHSADHDWAEWIAWRLEEAGYSIILQVWNFQVGADFSYALDTITKIAVQVLFILSPDFLKAFAAMPDWTSAFDKDPRSMAEQQILMAVQVRECMSEVEALVGEIVYTDLVGLDEKEAYAIIGKDIISKMPASTPGNKQRVMFERPRFPGTPLLKSAKAIEVFIAYSHADEALQRELVRHLTPLERQGLITLWSDRSIKAGEEWETTIHAHLNAAQIVLLLVSPDFLASSYAYSVEVKRAMERHEAGEAVVIPIILRPVDWFNTPFGKLSVLTKGGKALTIWERPDEALRAIIKGIQEVIEELSAHHSETFQKTKEQWEQKGSIPIFFPSLNLPDPKEFYNRIVERTQLLSRTRNRGCTSIVGPRRSGKTWLITYLRMVATEQLGPHFRIGYMNATSPSCTTIAAFTREALEALGVPSSVPSERLDEVERVAMFESDYPKVRRSLAQAALQDPYPACLLDRRGVIYAANLMAFWLWGALRPGEPIKPDTLLGNSIFNVLADNLERIPLDQNIEFYTKRSAMVKRLHADAKLPLYTPFIAAMTADPRLAQLYESALPTIDRKWEYPLRILHPGKRTSPELLELQVTNFRLEGDDAVLVVYVPTPATLPVIEAEYSLLMTTHSGERVYSLPNPVEQTTMENDQLLTSLQNAARAYYPNPLDLTVLEHFVGDMVAQEQTPILCIDEFEGLTYHSEFNSRFFSGLRAIAEVGLVLVVVSEEPLHHIVSERTKTSAFFNIFLQLLLAPFDRRDAEQFLWEKGAQAQFTDQDQAYLLAFAQNEKGQFPPLRLQLAGQMLLDDKRTAAIEGEQFYRPNDPAYWQAFKERVDAIYRGMIAS